ncbi:Clp protease ClpP [Variovorax paradoxus]|nr:head maturation protease, ClpP-related [Variovorax paradoxus]MBT2304701.1 Clp protease ClpP [Variovorax paradoxus]
MKPFFQVRASAGGGSTLSIYDEIGFEGVQAKDFRAALASVKAPTLNLEINSPGGDVFAAVAIYNMLKGSGKTIAVKVVGMAASAASYVAMAGHSIEMPKNTFMMVHNPMTAVRGNAEDLRGALAFIEKVEASITATYAARTGLSLDKLKAMLSKDTWLTADEALANGFATKVTGAIQIEAKAAAIATARANLPAPVLAALRPTASSLSTSALWHAHNNQGKTK